METDAVGGSVKLGSVRVLVLESCSDADGDTDGDAECGKEPDLV